MFVVIINGIPSIHLLLLIQFTFTAGRESNPGDGANQHNTMLHWLINACAFVLGFLE